MAEEKPETGPASAKGPQRQEQGARTASESAARKVEEARRQSEDALDQASEWAEDAYGRASEWASETYRDQSRRLGRAGRRAARQARHARSEVAEYVNDHPLAVGLVGFAAGLVIGALLPRTRRESEVFGEWAGDLRREGVRYASQAARRGKEYVEEAFEDEPREQPGRRRH